MILNESSSSKSLHKEVSAYIEKHKGDLLNYKDAMKEVKDLKKTDELDLINTIATLSNMWKDQKKHAKQFEKFLDMV
jgi:hypothetical protein